MKTQQAPTELIGFKAPKALAQRIRAGARRDDRTVSAFLRRKLTRDLISERDQTVEQDERS